MMKRQIFRQVALEQLSSPEQLDQLMQVTNPIGWLALAALGGLLVTAILWGIFGSISTNVAGQGILIAPGGVNNVVSMVSGQVVDIYFDVGDTVEAGQVVARVSQADQTVRARVVSPYTGHILEIKINEGDLVERGTPIVSVELLEEGHRQDLDAIIYVAPREGKKIKPGMEVQISPSTVKREEFGFMLGKVASVSEFPATYQGMFRLLGSSELVKALSAGGAPIEVNVELTPDQETASGYKWSSPQGPPIHIDSGTLCTAGITVSQQRPLSLVLPLFR
ncbi:MAG: NHLP bacteriocin system secretion protein [Ardenticatenaceae bacterium]|nr:NHLP bacteriocin system secretion protein [Ardenticatenaceae bacterium]